MEVKGSLKANELESSALKITGGAPANGKVLTSNALGVASWQTPGGGGSNPYAGTGSFVQTNAIRLNTQPRAMAYDGANLWVNQSDEGGGGRWLVKLGLDGSELNRYDLSDDIGQFDDIAFANGYIWIADNVINVLAKVDTSNGNIVGKFRTGHGGHGHITVDGSTLFISGSDNVNNSEPVIYKFDTTTGLFFGPQEVAEASVPDVIVGHGSVILLIDRTSSNLKKVYRDKAFAKLIYQFNSFGSHFYVALQDGDAGNSISVKYQYGATAGNEQVSVVGTDITVLIEQSATTDENIVKAVNAHPTASTLVYGVTSASSGHNWNPVINQQLFLNGGVDHLISTIDVSASGLPIDGVEAFGYWWVTMDNGDLLKINPGDDSIVTYPSGYSGLAGIAHTENVSGSGILSIATTGPSRKIISFDSNQEYFIKHQLPGNAPDSIAWDGGDNLWSIDQAAQNIKRFDRKTGANISTIDVSTYGTPKRGVFTQGFLWVATSGGDLLKIDASDSIVNYSSGGSLNGVTQSNGSTIYVSDAAAQQIIPFDIGSTTFGTPLDLLAINTPDDIAWDGGSSLWSLDLTSQTIVRLDTGGNVQGQVVVVTDAGQPRQMGSTLHQGHLWVTCASGNVVLCDPYGQINVRDYFDTGAGGDLSGIAMYEGDGSNFYFSATGAINGVVRSYFDGSLFFHRIIDEVELNNNETMIKIDNAAAWVAAEDGGSTIYRYPASSNFDPGTPLSISGNGNVKSIATYNFGSGSRMFVSTSTGKLVRALLGAEEPVASITIQDITFVAPGPGIGYYNRSVQYVGGNTGGAASLVAWDGTHAVVQIESGVTTASTIKTAMQNGGVDFAINLINPSAAQTVQDQTFFDVNYNSLSIDSADDLGKAALGGLEDRLNVVGFTSPTNGYIRFCQGHPYIPGTNYHQGSPQLGTIASGDLWIADWNNQNSMHRIDRNTMQIKACVEGIGHTRQPVTIGGNVYVDDSDSLNIYKVDPGTNKSIKTIPVGLGQGFWNNSYVFGLFFDGVNLWCVTFNADNFFTQLTIEKLVNDLMINIMILPGQENGDDYSSMLLIDDFLFLRLSSFIIKYNANLG